jgi:ribosomal protein S24E
MKFKIVEEKENPMLKRKEIIMSLDYEGGSTPSKADLQKLLSEQLNANIENVEISKIMSEIGRTRGMSWVKIWQEKKVPIYSEKKKETPKEEAPKEEPKKEETKAEETPKEEEKPEVKEEKPEEEPKQEGQKEKENES